VVTEVDIHSEIVKLKQQLELTVAEHKYNFQHPRVIAVSQELDKLITLVMKNKWHGRTVL
jgi:hypothetical protein